MKTSILNTEKYWMSDRFKELILGDIKEVQPYKKEITSFISEKNEYDSEIIKRVKTFTREECISLLIKLTKDTNSILLKDWKSNLFYVNIGSRTVGVAAWLDGGVWLFDCYGLDEDSSWSAGSLVLSPAMVDTQTLGTDDTLTLGSLDARLKKLESLFKLENL